MKSSELETMRKSFSTVKRRSSSIKDLPSIKRLTSRVREIKKYSFDNKDELFSQVLESFKRNDIECRFDCSLKRKTTSRFTRQDPLHI